jgi:hypothetical protein
LCEIGSRKGNAKENFPALPEPKEGLVKIDARVSVRRINKTVLAIAQHRLSSPLKGVNLADYWTPPSQTTK